MGGHIGMVIVCLILLMVVRACDSCACSPRDDRSLPSKGTSIERIAPSKTFESEVRDRGKFEPRLYLIFEDTDSDHSDLMDGLSFFFKPRYLAASIEGARTAVFVRSGSHVVGKWVTSILGTEKGNAVANAVEICCLDLAQPSRRRVLRASSRPGSTNRDGMTTIDAEEFSGQYSKGMMLQALLGKCLEDAT